MKRIFKGLLCLVLAISMATLTTLQALAAGAFSTDTMYVSEIKMAIASSLDEAKHQLKDFTVVESDLNRDQGNGAKAVYMGYKTTTDKNQAITDLRFMDMNGGYSYCDYEKALEEQLENAQKEIDSFSDAVKEFQKNYKAGSENALYAYSEMNKYKDDDQNALIGDLFIDENVTTEKLQTIFMEGNGSIIAAIEELLAIGCADNWLERLADNAKNVYDSSAFVLEEYCEPIRAQWDALYKGLVMYDEQLEDENGYDLYDFTEESFEEWCKADGVNDAMISVVVNYGSAYVMLEDIDFKGGTLLDYFMVPLDEVDYEYLYPIADAMTKGQIQTMKYIGLTKALCYANVDMSLIGEALKENKERIQQVAVDAANKGVTDESEMVEATNADTTVSVYAGVDRSLFEQGSGVALTNDVIRDSSSSDDASAISQVLKNAKTELIITGVVGTAAIVGTTLGLIFKSSTKVVEYAAGGVIEVVYEYTSKPLTIFWGSTLGVSIGATIIIAGVFMYLGYKDYMNPTYLTVPRAIVDQKTQKVYDSYGKEVGEKKSYYAYYPVEDAYAYGENGKYADMNGWKAQQWNVMYYTKDKNAGEPILANTFVVQYGDNKAPNGYKAFSGFGLTAAADINKHAFKATTGIYLFYKTATATTGLASVFTNGYYALTALAGLAVGAGATAGIVAILNKKRKKTEVPVEA